MRRMMNVKSATNELDLDKSKMLTFEIEGYEGGIKCFINQQSYRVRKMKEKLVHELGIDEEIVCAFKEAVLDEDREDRRYDGCCNC